MNRPEDPSTLFPIPDVQAGSDDRRIAIDQVGIKGLRYPLHFADVGGVAQPTIADCNVYVALPAGAYLYDAKKHALTLVAASDLRRVTGYQDFVDEAPLDLVYVADHRRMRMVPVGQRESYASAAAGAIAQNVYLFAAANGLVTVIRAWIDRAAIADALGLTHDQHVLLSQTVGYPKR